MWNRGCTRKGMYQSVKRPLLSSTTPSNPYLTYSLLSSILFFLPPGSIPTSISSFHSLLPTFYLLSSFFPPSSPTLSILPYCLSPLISSSSNDTFTQYREIEGQLLCTVSASTICESILHWKVSSGVVQELSLYNVFFFCSCMVNIASK